MSTARNMRLQKAIFEVISNQIRENSPPETGATLLRLIKEGHSREDAMTLIGHVVAQEVVGVLEEGRVFDEKGYIEKLNALPALPWQSTAEARPDKPGK